LPGKAEPLNNLGLVFESAGRLDEAAEQFERALALAPENMEAAANLSRAYARAGKPFDRMSSDASSASPCGKMTSPLRGSWRRCGCGNGIREEIIGGPQRAAQTTEEGPA
jgi:tetratricopeptide (TPR) repeat protein